MTAAISGGLSLASGLVGMIGGMRGAKAAASPGISPLMYMLSGQEEQAAARAEASALSRQSSLAYEQSLLEAAQKERQVTAFKEQQALKFASSGMTLEGSPLAVLEETRALGQQETDAIRRRGEEVSRLYEMEGLQMLRRGSAAAFGGFANALQSQFQSQQQAAAMKNQAFQSGLSGITSGVQAFGAMKSSNFSNPLAKFFQPGPTTPLASKP